MLVHARIATKGQESRIECEGIRDYLSYSKTSQNTTRNGNIHQMEERQVCSKYVATLVCWYMHELQQKDRKVVLSVKALETIYHTANSLIGNLISGKQYLGGYALEQV